MEVKNVANEPELNEQEKAVVRHFVLRPLSIRHEEFFVISVEDFTELIKTTQYKNSVFSKTDRVPAC